MVSATEKLAEHGKAWVAIGKAVEMAMLIEKKNVDLAVILETTRKQAEQLENLEIKKDETLSDLQQPVDELRKVAKEIWNSCTSLEATIKILKQKADEFDEFVMQKMPNMHVPSEFLAEFCRLLENLYQTAKGFSEEYLTFTQLLKTIEDDSIKSYDLIKIVEKKLESSASRAERAGTVGIGALLAAPGLIALGFFSGGVAAVAAVAGGGALGIVGGFTADKSFKELSKLRKLAGEIDNAAGSIRLIADELSRVGEMAEEFKLNRMAIEALLNARKYFEEEIKRKNELDETKAELEKTKTDLEKAIAETRRLEELMARLSSANAS